MHLKSETGALLIILYSLRLQAYTPDGYVGCFKEQKLVRVLSGISRDFYPNGGNICKQFCSNEGYRYAGTESGEECFCGDHINYMIRATDCNRRCEGNYRELCGGHWRISIYDTWQKSSVLQLPPRNPTVTVVTVISTSRETAKRKPDVSAKSEDNPNSSTTALYVIPLSVLMPLIIIVALVVSIAVYWRRRKLQRIDDHTYCEPDYYAMTVSSQQHNSAPDTSTVVKPSTHGQLEYKTQTSKVTGENYNSKTMHSDIKPSNEDSYDMLQRDTATDSEYETIEKDNACTRSEGNYKKQNNDTVPEDEYLVCN